MNINFLYPSMRRSLKSRKEKSSKKRVENYKIMRFVNSFLFFFCFLTFTCLAATIYFVSIKFQNLVASYLSCFRMYVVS